MPVSRTSRRNPAKAKVMGPADGMESTLSEIRKQTTAPQNEKRARFARIAMAKAAIQAQYKAKADD